MIGKVFTRATLLLFALTITSAYAADRPNVVLILIDDLGWADLGVSGSTFYETPNVNRLAAEGVYFNDAYAANPVCSPTRASIQTGKYPSRLKITNHSGIRGAMGPQYPLNPPVVEGSMPLEDTTLAEALREAGYTTAHIGKWHLQPHGETGRAHFPEANGFDINIAGHNAGQPGSFYFPYKSDEHAWSNVPDLGDGAEGDYLTDILTDKAIDFITSHRDGPFYLNLWYYTVHTPIEPRKDKVEKYRGKAKAMGLDKTIGEAVREHESFTRAQQDEAAYASMVESMDENIGRILDTLKALNLDGDTIVIFTSDNGGLSTGKSPNSPTSNLPLRAGKGWVYEGGIRVPLIIRYPGAVRAGVTSAEPVVSTDFYPTILDMAGLPLRPEQHLDGQSLKPLLTGSASSLDRDAIYFHYPHYHPFNTMGPSGAVRARDYKLIEVFETGDVELYDLSKDVGEKNDLSLEMPEVADRLKQMLHAWREETGSLMPTPNPDYVDKNKTHKSEDVVINGRVEETAFYTPDGDKDGLAAASAFNPDLPNVLLIGDSISIGYTAPTIAALSGEANVRRINTNSGTTENGLRYLDRWLGTTRWDVIHFNFGLHDLCYRHPESKEQGNRDKINGTQAVPIDAYAQNLEQIVVRLKATGAMLVWASTTIVPEGEAGRFAGDEVRYNEAVGKIMKQHGVAINDLHALSASFNGQYSGLGDVHFNKKGSARLAEQVAVSIRAALP
jgi:arylsulfatase A-like enzyme/lysophospholipase L1-like esterase